jgi:uncharacterized BrkB/YihY/UPF0761 family membrane protein
MATPTADDNKILGLERTPFIVITVLFIIALLLIVFAIISFASKKKKGKYGITKSSISESSKGFTILMIFAVFFLVVTPIILFAIVPNVQKDDET